MISWSAIFAAHATELKSVLARVLGDPAEAEDCVQEAALRILDQPIADIRDPRAFLFQVGYNLARDALRRRSTRGGESLDDLPPGHEPGDPNPGPDAILAARQQWAEVAAALDDMAPQRKRVLWLMRVEGKSQKEVAAELGLSPKTVENHMTLALKTLLARVRRSGP